MSRYKISVRDSGSLVRDDEEWQEFATFHALRHEAIESAREILSEAVLSGDGATLDVTIEVMDEAGTIVLTMPVGHVVGTESQTA